MNTPFACLLGLSAFPNIPRTVAAEPTAILLVCVRVEADCHEVSLLDVELSDFVFAKQVEKQSFRIFVIRFQHILLDFPFSFCRPSLDKMGTPLYSHSNRRKPLVMALFSMSSYLSIVSL